MVFSMHDSIWPNTYVMTSHINLTVKSYGQNGTIWTQQTKTSIQLIVKNLQALLQQLPTPTQEPFRCTRSIHFYANQQIDNSTFVRLTWQQMPFFWANALLFSSLDNNWEKSSKIDCSNNWNVFNVQCSMDWIILYSFNKVSWLQAQSQSIHTKCIYGKHEANGVVCWHSKYFVCRHLQWNSWCELRESFSAFAKRPLTMTKRRIPANCTQGTAQHLHHFVIGDIVENFYLHRLQLNIESDAIAFSVTCHLWIFQSIEIPSRC